jgi:hypothetical protein
VWWLEPTILTVLGALLGIADTSASGGSAWLRVPALIAALLLVAQGLLDLENKRRVQGYESPAPLPSAAAVGLEAAPAADPESPGRAAYREAVHVTVKPVPGSTMRENRNVVSGVMGLSIWLGLATLKYPHDPRLLVSLSLIAAFLLFANAWAMLRGRR